MKIKFLLLDCKVKLEGNELIIETTNDRLRMDYDIKGKVENSQRTLVVKDAKGFSSIKSYVMERE